MRIRRKYIVLIFPLLLIALSPAASHAILPGGDVYFGYSRLNANTFGPNLPGLNGWDAAGHLKLVPFLGAEIDVAQYGYGAASTVPRTTTFMAGPRVTVGAAGVHVFAHGLVGGRHSNTSTGPTAGSTNGVIGDFGGGVDFKIAPFFAWRVTADYIDKSGRFGTGLVFHF